MLHVRIAESKDLEHIAKTHIECFSNHFSSSLGERLLKKYYECFLNAYPDLFLVALDNNQIIGFAMGYPFQGGNQTRRFIHKHFFLFSLRFLFLLFIRFDKRAWGKVFSKKEKYFSYEYPPFDCLRTGDLLSICLGKNYRGSGLAKEMLDKFIAQLSKRDFNFCVLSTNNDNFSAQKFYEKNGFVLGAKTSKAFHYYKHI